MMKGVWRIFWENDSSHPVLDVKFIQNVWLFKVHFSHFRLCQWGRIFEIDWIMTLWRKFQSLSFVQYDNATINLIAPRISELSDGGTSVKTREDAHQTRPEQQTGLSLVWFPSVWNVKVNFSILHLFIQSFCLHITKTSYSTNHLLNITLMQFTLFPLLKVTKNHGFSRKYV